MDTGNGDESQYSPGHSNRHRLAGDCSARIAANQETSLKNRRQVLQVHFQRITGGQPATGSWDLSVIKGERKRTKSTIRIFKACHADEVYHLPSFKSSSTDNKTLL